LRIGLVQHAVLLTLVLVDILARAFRIRLLLPGSIWGAALINTCGDGLAGITPARWGGEPLRFLAFRKQASSGTRVLAAFATELSVDAVMILAISLILVRWLGAVSGPWVHRIAMLLTIPLARVIMIIVALATAVGVLLVIWLRRFLGHGHSYAGCLHDAFKRTPGILVRMSLWTVISIVSRAALLPVLAASVPGADMKMLFVGSFTLLFAQSVLPMPGGAGAVDLAFAGLFTPALAGRGIGQLLLVWRFYTWGLAALVGAAMLCVVWRRASGKRSPPARNPYGTAITPSWPSASTDISTASAAKSIPRMRINPAPPL